MGRGSAETKTDEPNNINAAAARCKNNKLSHPFQTIQTDESDSTATPVHGRNQSRSLVLLSMWGDCCQSRREGIHPRAGWMQPNAGLDPSEGAASTTFRRRQRSERNLSPL